jgi:hypothetical protein
MMLASSDVELSSGDGDLAACIRSVGKQLLVASSFRVPSAQVS